jgi:ATP synthase protein I
VSERPPRGTGTALLAVATWVTLAAGLVCSLVAAVGGGTRALVSAVLATGLVLGFLWIGQLPVAAASRGHRALGAALLLLGYTARVAVLLLAFRLFAGAEFLDRRTFGLTIIITALSWTGGGVWSLLRWRAPADVGAGRVPGHE